ncbi:ParB/RepB/Spo0J family partition protein [Planktothrix paucivesiculata]|uniref:ParB-like N-terminal domain-containing protein n=1 Tax=Planktothrix paucivesiculata PCC 9631 TaxID=671071 RepID=A0A7Z9E0L6_9CYAN|nr:ParB N-terminal domain-containing protein [Planktothrix paucivesiculata]VXD16780.1 hypothetical protein PL9631_250060 [Planktothrix paucivesiculata PCC 9631]
MNTSQTQSLKSFDVIEYVPLNHLKPHPRNEAIYGRNENLTDLMEAIALKGYVRPLLIKTDGTIISGHRRWRTLLALGWEKAPVQVCHFESEDEELFVLIAENRQRQQTTVQKIREGMIVEPLARKLRNCYAFQTTPRTSDSEITVSSQNPQHPSMENFPLARFNLNLNGKQMQLTENIVAAIVGLGCGRTYRKGRVAIQAADLLHIDEPKLAEVWLEMMNQQSIDAGYQLAKIPEEKRKMILDAIATGAAKTPKQAKILLKAQTIFNPIDMKAEPDSQSPTSAENQSLTDEPDDIKTTQQEFTPAIGTWVIIKIPLVPKERIPQRKWNGFWGRITAVGITVKVDMGSEILSLLLSDVEVIENPQPDFCQVAERILRLQRFDTVHEFGKMILNRMQKRLSWDAATLTYLDAVEQIELAHRAIEQAF